MSEKIWSQTDNWKNYYFDYIKWLQKSDNFQHRVMIWKSKIKLHGTNAVLKVLDDGSLQPYKRTDICTIENDNAGWAMWTHRSFEPYWKTWNSPHNQPLNWAGWCIAGEWFGPGVQNGVAASQIAKKAFAIFALIDPQGVVIHDFDRNVYVRDLIDFVTKHDDVFELPVFKTQVVDMSDPVAVTAFTSEMQNDIEAIASVDPFIKDTFGIEGPGEGLVFFSDSNGVPNKFKAKTEKFATVDKISPKVRDLSKEEELLEFARSLTHHNRLDQMFAETFPSGEYSVKDVGTFIRAVSQDVVKECRAEVIESGYDAKHVFNKVPVIAKEYFFDKLRVA